jgi:hypothetical protein
MVMTAAATLNVLPLHILVACVWALGVVATAGAEEGWIADKNGCKIANPTPRPNESVTWDGACVDGFADGSGVMQWYVNAAPGPRYEGTVRGGVISGRGKLTLPDGTRYDGEWVDGKQQGNGTLSASDGSTYRGEWKDGEPDGRGTMRSASGDIVRGNWKQGTYVGPGDDDAGKQR